MHPSSHTTPRVIRDPGNTPPQCLIMAEPPTLGGRVFHTVGAPVEVFPDSSWAGNSNLGMTPTDLRDQFGTREPPLGAVENTVFLQSTHDEFLHINQAWLLCARTPTEIMATPVHQYAMQTQAEKYHTLTTMPLGVGALIMVQWVANTSDGGDAQLTNPVVLVLGPLLTPPQEGSSISTMLTDAWLDFHKPAKPLGKMWPSERIYPLVSPLFRDT